MRGKEVWCADFTVHGHEEAEACQTIKKMYHKKERGSKHDVINHVVDEATISLILQDPCR
jgi:hypothetical protein